MSRTARIERTTSESDVVVELDLDGTGATDISTTVPFYDHMLTALGKHSLIDLTVRATGDTHIDVHHTVEDTAICIGEALRAALEHRLTRSEAQRYMERIARFRLAGWAGLLGPTTAPERAPETGERS